jgi:molybdopterin adenylyltransferase
VWFRYDAGRMSTIATKPRVITVTISDTRTENDDTSGKALMDELKDATVQVRHVIVKDEAEAIARLVRSVSESDEADAMVLSGGTGIAPRDVTYEAVAGLFDKTLDGFGETFRRMSWDEIGPRAMLSRATAGTIGKCVVFVVPGSEKGARLGAKLIAPIVGHAFDLINGRTKHHPPPK